jgi:hypothetical protein
MADLALVLDCKVLKESPNYDGKEALEVVIV